MERCGRECRIDATQFHDVRVSHESMSQYRVASSTANARALAFVRRVHPMRMLGAWLLALPYASVMLEQRAPWGVWLAMGFNVLLWPHLAFLWARSSRRPAAAEFRNLLLDAMLGGFWIAVSQVSLVPAVATVSILAADRLAAGGWRLLGRAALVMLVSFLLCWSALGMPLQPVPTLRTLVLSMLPVFVYTLALSHVTHRLGRQIVQQNRELDRLNHTDTGLDLPNRRFFNQRAAEAIAQAREHGHDAVLLLVDVDRFKSINDCYGHGVGDQVLRQIAQLLHEQAGEDGFPARIGGDEFALLLACPPAQAAAVADSLRRAVAGVALPHCPGLVPGVSIGMAALEPGHRGLDDWMGAADRAMYAAKADGRGAA